MKKFIPLNCCIAFLILTGCHYSKSVKKDFISGITTAGRNLSCEDIFVTVNDEKKSGNVFIYGETFDIDFSNVTGFEKTDDKVFPDMVLTVVNKSGDTMLYSDNLLSEYAEGINISSLDLQASFTVAAPIKSKEEYKAIVKIRDKKGDGTLTAEYPFKVIENDKIETEFTDATAQEIYIYCEETDQVITDNKINFDNNIHIVVEGLRGFSESDGMVFPGLSFKATDAENNIILASDDLFTGYTESGIDAASLTRRVSPHFSIPETDNFKNPLHCEMSVWDKKGTARIKVSTDLILE